MISEEIKDLSDFLISHAPEQSEFHPIDRKYLDRFIDKIFEVRKDDFIVYNLEFANITYTNYLFACLPELWQDITISDVVNISRKFTTAYSYFGLIHFMYKYIEVDSINLYFNFLSGVRSIDDEVKNYIKSQYPHFVKDESDYFYLDANAYGININQWLYVKQRMLIDKRLRPAVKSVDVLRNYVESL